MTDPSLEVRVSQLADGSLPPEERAEIEAQIAADPRAGQAYAEYRRLDRLLGSTLQLPPLRWDRLNHHLSGMVADGIEPAVAGRIARTTPGRFGLLASRRFATAASLLLAAGVASLLALHKVDQPHGIISSPTVAPSSFVVGPQAEVAKNAAASVQINVGPSPALASQGGEWRYAEGVVSTPPRVQSFGKAAPPSGDESPLH